MRLCKQTIALAVVGTADLVSTLWFWKVHGATEANPLMALFLAQGVVAFVLAKAALLVAPLAVIEWARRRRPVFVARASTFALVAYVGLYVVGVSRLNADSLQKTMVTPAARQAVWQRLRAEYASRARNGRTGKPAHQLSTSYVLGALRDAGEAGPYGGDSM